MARSRNIKPGFFTDGQLTKLPIPARLLFAALWCLADREGRLSANESDIEDIELFAFPRDSVDINELLDALATNFIILYEVDGNRYIQVKNFKKHQSPHAKEQASAIPPLVCAIHASDMPGACTGQAQGKHPLDSLNSGFPDSLIPDTPPAPSKGRRTPIADFNAFWRAYPKKKSKGEAEKAWKSIHPDSELLATMLDKLAIATTCHDWTKESGKYIPYPASWLRAKGWEDEDAQVKPKTAKDIYGGEFE